MSALAGQLLVIAKEPVPGRVKTRLTPPFTPCEAAELAAAALADTLDVVAAVPAARRVLALDGRPGAWLPHGFDVIPQRGGGLDERIACAMTDAWRAVPLPIVLIGMDTPQVTAQVLSSALRAMGCGVPDGAHAGGGPAGAGGGPAGAGGGPADAVYGPAEDGGFWLLGLREPDPALLLGVPMSAPDTGAHQLARLRAAGLRIALAPPLTDIDTVREAELVAAELVAAKRPESRFAARLRALTATTASSVLRLGSGTLHSVVEWDFPRNLEAGAVHAAGHREVV